MIKSTLFAKNFNTTLKLLGGLITMSCKIAEQGQLLIAPVQLIWENLVTVTSWKDWMPGVKKVELLESPKVGAIGRIHSGASKRSFEFVQLMPRTRIQWEIPYMFGTKLVQSCSLVKNAEGTILTLEVFCYGRWERQVKLLFGRKLGADLFAQAESFRALCESQCSEVTRSRDVEQDTRSLPMAS